MPRLFGALTVQVYDLPGVSAVTVTGPAVPVLVLVVPPFDEVQVALYRLIAAPLFAGARNWTLSEPGATFDATGFAIWAGAPTVTAADGADAGPTPRLFVARILHV